MDSDLCLKVISLIWPMFRVSCFLIISRFQKLGFWVFLVLLFASIKRFVVSCMRDFLLSYVQISNHPTNSGKARGEARGCSTNTSVIK